MLIKQTNCPICRDILDYFSDTQTLMRCEACKTIFHEDCWKLISRCSNCHGDKTSIVDKTFFINEIFETPSQDGEA